MGGKSVVSPQIHITIIRFFFLPLEASKKKTEKNLTQEYALRVFLKLSVGETLSRGASCVRSGASLMKVGTDTGRQPHSLSNEKGPITDTPATGRSSREKSRSPNSAPFYNILEMTKCWKRRKDEWLTGVRKECGREGNEGPRGDRRSVPTISKSTSGCFAVL